MRDKGLKRESSDYDTINCSHYQVKNSFTINLYYLRQHFWIPKCNSVLRVAEKNLVELQYGIMIHI